MKFTSEDLLKAMGLKLGDTIKYNRNEYVVFFNQACNEIAIKTDPRNHTRVISPLSYLVDEDYTIIQPKPTLTEDEKVILRNLPKEYDWIARNKGKDIVTMFTDFPDRDKEVWEFCDASWNLPFRNLFQFIKWEDEPYSIEELLKE